MPEIVINGRFLGRRVTGVERYGREVLHFLGDRARLEEPSGRANAWIGHAWEQFVLPGRIGSDSVLWSPANSGPILVGRQALTIHDLTPLEHPEWFRTSFAAWYRTLLPLLAHRVRRIIVPSDFIRRKVTARFALPLEKVVTIPGGVDKSKFHSSNVSKDVGRYILFVGTMEPRKNLSALLAAWNRVKRLYGDVCLIVAGGTGPVFKNSPVPGSDTQVRLMGYVPEQALPGLYAGAELFVLPSLDEGFGLTALEAMACGTPVLVSDGGALPELVGDAGKIFRLSDSSGLSDAIAECLSHPAVRADMREKGLQRAERFSWKTTAESIWSTLNEI